MRYEILVDQETLLETKCANLSDEQSIYRADITISADSKNFLGMSASCTRKRKKDERIRKTEMKKKIEFQIEITEDKVREVLGSRTEEIEDFGKFLEYLKARLPPPLEEHIEDEIEYFYDRYTGN